MTSHRKSPRRHPPHLAWLVPCLTRLSWAAALLGLGVVLLFHQPAHAASCVPVKDGQDEAFGNPYWLSGYYLNSLMHPHQHKTYPAVELTWYQHDADNLAGYKVVAEDAYTTDGNLSKVITTLAKMPLYVTVGKDTRRVRMPNMASHFRTWVVYALFTNGSSQKIASTSLICGQDVRENRSQDGEYVYVELVATNGTTREPKAISSSDWEDYACHYDLPDEYARGDPDDEFKPGHYPFTDSWNWGSPMVGVLVDDSYDVEGHSDLRECLSDKPTAHLAGEWDIEAITFTHGEAVPWTVDQCQAAYPASCDVECPTWTVDECQTAYPNGCVECTLDECQTAYPASCDVECPTWTVDECQTAYPASCDVECPTWTVDECQAAYPASCDVECPPTEECGAWTLTQCQDAYSPEMLCPFLASDLTDCQDKSADGNPPPDVNTDNPPDNNSGGGNKSGGGGGVALTPIHGMCGQRAYTCDEGIMGNKDFGDETFEWECLGENDGRTVPCSSPRTTAFLDTPQDGKNVSGISVVHGWLCEADSVGFQYKAGEDGWSDRVTVPYGGERLDTEFNCGHPHTGFSTAVNWSRLPEGPNRIRILVDGSTWREVQVDVTSFGIEFLRGVEGECVAPDFPTAGQTTIAEWHQSQQNFVITDVE